MDDVLAVLMNAVRHLLHREVARSGEMDGELHEHLAAVTAASDPEMPAAPAEASPQAGVLMPSPPDVPYQQVVPEAQDAENEHAEDHA